MSKEISTEKVSEANRLVPEVNAHHRECLKSGADALQNAMKAGALLAKMKKMVPHGEWGAIVKRLDCNERTSQLYVQLSEKLPAIVAKNKELGADLTIRGGMKLISEAKPKAKPKAQRVALLTQPAKGKADTKTDIPNNPPNGPPPPPEPETEEEEATDPAELDAEPEKELTFEEKVKEVNSRIESFCRQLVQWFADNCPKVESVDHQGRYDSALAHVRAACGTMRTCKLHDEPCPKCKGDGCKTCEKESDFGAISVYTHKQVG